MIPRFRKDTAATLRFTPKEGPPTGSATVVLYSPDGSVKQASASAAVPTVATEVNGAYPIGTSTLRLDSITGITAGSFYWIGDIGTENLQLVEVEEIDSAALTVTLAEALNRAVRDNADFRGSELTYALTVSHTDTADENFRAEWSYTVNSVAHSDVQLFDVYKRIFRLPLTEKDLRPHLAAPLIQVAALRGSLKHLLDEAEAMVLRELRRLGYKADLIRDASQFQYLGIIAIRRILIRRRIDAGEVEAIPIMAEIDNDWRNEWDQLTATGVRWYDVDEDLAFSDASETDSTSEDESYVQRVAHGVLA